MPIDAIIFMLRIRLIAVATALTLGALSLPPPADASIPSAISHPQLTQPAADPTLPASYVLLSVAPDGSFRVEFCRNDPRLRLFPDCIVPA